MRAAVRPIDGGGAVAASVTRPGMEVLARDGVAHLEPTSVEPDDDRECRMAHAAFGEAPDDWAACPRSPQRRGSPAFDVAGTPTEADTIETY